MEKVSVISDKQNVLNIVMSLIVVGLCALAMFGVPSMSSQGPSQIATAGPSVFSIISIGLAIGCYGTIVGIGGGPLIVPILVLFYGWDNEILVATSLFIVFLNALSGSVGYARQKRIEYKGAIKFSLAAIPGALLSAFIHHTFDIKAFDLMFGIFLIFLAVYSLVSAKKMDREIPKINKKLIEKGHRLVELKDKFNDKFKFTVDDGLGIKMNLILGFFVGFLGIGGGVFQVPVLIFLLKYPPHIATATSHFVTMATCLFALIPHLFLGNVMFDEALWMGVGIVTGAQLGAYLSPKLNAKLIVYLFVLILFVFALKMFL
ncbi:MAG: sulfite exporter TauE/SafE family protein [Candidatus Omnitrophica bacterium]|nr:sulfite exporter TauE/SafE family protein [Candidatus Omnitrophota bacterium]